MSHRECFFIFHAALLYSDSGDTDLTEYYFDLSDKSISAYGTRFKDIHIPGENPFIPGYKPENF